MYVYIFIWLLHCCLVRGFVFVGLFMFVWLFVGVFANVCLCAWLIV